MRTNRGVWKIARKAAVRAYIMGFRRSSGSQCLHVDTHVSACAAAGGKSKFVCIYDTEERLMLRRFQACSTVDALRVALEMRHSHTALGQASAGISWAQWPSCHSPSIMEGDAMCLTGVEEQVPGWCAGPAEFQQHH